LLGTTGQHELLVLQLCVVLWRRVENVNVLKPGPKHGRNVNFVPSLKLRDSANHYVEICIIDLRTLVLRLVEKEIQRE
jgi:hypothetical protein